MIDKNIELFCEDCKETLSRVSNKSVQLVLQDPPYGITQNKWDEMISFELWPEWERIVKDDGIIIFTSQQPFTTHLIMSNIKLFKYTMVWEKTRPVGFLNANRRPLSTHEDIVLFYKKQPKYRPIKTLAESYSKTNVNQVTSNNYGHFVKPKIQTLDGRYPGSVIKVSNFNGRLFGKEDPDIFHPTQKPVNLLRWFIQAFTDEGDTVFDGYSGSGSTAVACLKENRKFIGSEINLEYYEKSISRIRKDCLQSSLFGATQ